MRLIDADAYAEEMKKRQDACKEWTQRTIDTADEENYLRSCGAYVVFVEAKLLLEKQPTIDAVEVVRGRWLRTDAFPHRIYCSVCFKTYVTNEEVIQGRSWDCPIYAYEAEYCPHCGAKMRGEVKIDGN